MPEFQTTPFGDYVLQDRIGAGGMAEIFLATSQGIEGFEKRLVIKRILPTLSDDEQFVRMFIEEAKLCVALRHPNIVQVYDLGVIDGQYYIAMEYVDGRDLLKTLAGCGKKKIGFPTDIALYIVMEALKGLDYAHRLESPDKTPLGIIHRDVSPSNLLLSFEGEVKLGDFGIAKASTREKTATGILKGKFGYMAPEQVTGAQIDHRADVFAVGIVLYELLTGHRLFAGKNDLLVLERVRDAVIDPRPKHYRPDLDDELEDIVLRALSRRAEDRFQHAGEVHDAIHDYVYRSRAMVGPAQLARFMQGLFLSDPEEIARRNRVRLPPVPHPDSAQAADPTPPAGQPASFGFEATQDERGQTPAALEDHGFDEKTPLVDLESAPSSSLSAVVYISEEYQWGPDGEPVDDTRHEPDSVVEPQPLRGDDDERTVQTDLGEPPTRDASDPAIMLESDALVSVHEDSQRYVATKTPDPKGEVLALRHARDQDAPTDFELAEEARAAAQGRGRVKVSAAPTRDDMSAVPRSESITTELTEELDELDDQDVTRTGSDTVEPAAIVERTRITPLEPEAPEADVEPTVQFDSTVFPALRDPPDPAEVTVTADEPNSDPSIQLVDGVVGEYFEEDEKSEFGTVEVAEADLPTAEVDGHELEALTEGPEEGTEVAKAPIGGAKTRPTALPAPDPFDEPPHEEEDETQLRDDAGGELAALIARYPSSAVPVEAMPQPEPLNPFDDEEDEASRTDLFDPVEEGMVAEIAARASAPARRRPLSSRRARPVLMPAEREGSTPRSSSQANGYGRRRSSPRRRVATRVPLSVVNPQESKPRDPSATQALDVEVREEPAERAVSTIPAPVVDARASTGAGSLVDVEAYSDDPAQERRSSSGVTAALSEAALVDEQIAELRKSSVTPRDQTTAGQLADSARPNSEVDFDDLTEDGVGSDLRSAILRRQSRRRMVTRSFVLYDDDGEGETTRGGASFAEESEQSVPALDDAGQLDDEGASELFGVLSVLDEERPDFDFDSEDEVSMETDARFYADLSDSFGVRTETPPPRLDSEQAQAEEFGATSLGSLTPDDTGDMPMVDYGRGSEEPTNSVSDGQVLSISQLDSQLPGPDVMPQPGDLSGLDLEFTDDGPFSERSSAQPEDPSARGDLLDDEGPMNRFSEFEEPTQEQSRDESTGIGRLRPQIEQADLTSGERPSHRGGLVSDSFELGPDQQERWRNAYASSDAPEDSAPPDRPDRSDRPVRPRSMVPPAEPMEVTASQLASADSMAPKPRGNLSVLRAVVERQKVAKERVRAPGDTRASEERPSPVAPALHARGSAAPAHAAGSVGAVAPPRGGPSVAEVYPPAMQAARRNRTWNTASYIFVGLAIALAVAAAVSSLFTPEGPGPIPAQPEQRAGLIDVPEPPQEAAEAPKAPGAASPDTAAAAGEAKDEAKPKTGTPKTVGAVGAVGDASPTETAAPAPAPEREVRPKPVKTKRRARKKAPRRRARRAPKDSSKATLRLKCSDPVDVRISTVGTRKNKTRLEERLEPGWYRVKLYRGGEKVNQVDVNLLAGQSVSIPCP